MQLVDIDRAKAGVAGQLGIEFCSPEDARPDADLVLHASASAEGLATALQIAGLEATVVELSWFGDRSIALPLGEAFHSRRLTLRSSQVGAIDARQRSRWTPARRNELVFELLEAPVLDVLITGESRFDELPEVLERLTSAPGQTLCHRIVYP